jgi:hypothetical protein
VATVHGLTLGWLVSTPLGWPGCALRDLVRWPSWGLAFPGGVFLMVTTWLKGPALRAATANFRRSIASVDRRKRAVEFANVQKAILPHHLDSKEEGAFPDSYIPAGFSR